MTLSGLCLAGSLPFIAFFFIMVFGVPLATLASRPSVAAFCLLLLYIVIVGGVFGLPLLAALLAPPGLVWRHVRHSAQPPTWRATALLSMMLVLLLGLEAAVGCKFLLVRHWP